MTGRPRTVDMNGRAIVICIRVSQSVGRALQKEAKETGKTVSAVVREKLEKTI